MKIGIDCRTILNPGHGELAGVGHYTYYLVKNLLALDKKNNYVLFFDNRFRSFSQFEQANVAIRTFPFYQYKKYLPLAYSQMLISAVLDREKLDIFHSPANTLPLPYNRAAVVTVHDLAIYKYPKLFPGALLDRQSFATKILVPRSLAKAAKIIAVSKNTKKDIIEEFGVAEDKIEVIYEGVAGGKKDCPQADFFQAVKHKFGLGDKYFLFIGTIEPRKNLVALIRAFRNLKLIYDSPVKDYQLIIAGASGWSDAAIYEAIADANASILGQKKQRHGCERRSGFDNRSGAKKQKQGERRIGNERRLNQPIRHLGYVSQQEKLSLLCHAASFVFPSLYEGFGLPVLEAMSLGAPVITSNLSSLPEIAGENNALFVDPSKEAEIGDALQQIVMDVGLREALIINGYRRAQEFGWRQCAQATLAVYQAALAK
jgi:glycosyltransferase involved in cell wall biosynthesis